jgi:hypothetical protein
MSAPTLSVADRLAHFEAQGPVRQSRPAKPQRTVLHRVPAGNPRGSWPAEEFAAEQRREGIPAEVILDLPSDNFLVIVEVAS